jgi:hypothetical protein
MQVKKKPTAWVLATLFAIWQLVVQPIWNLNVEKVAEHDGLDGALVRWRSGMSAAWSLAQYVPSSFGLGFVCGGLIFAYWDTAVAWFRRRVLKKDSALPSPESVEIKAWLGEASVSLSESDPSQLRLFLRVLNWGTAAFKVSRVEGSMVLGHDNGFNRMVYTPLAVPALVHNRGEGDTVQPGHIRYIELQQHLPSKIVKILPDMLSWSMRPSIELKDLSIILQSEGLPDKPLGLPDSLRITAGEWVVRTDQTSRLFKTEEERIAFAKSMTALTQSLTRLGG